MSEPDDDVVVAVCGRTTHPPAVPGSKVGACAACGMLVWVSPATLELQPDALVCVYCAPLALAAYPDAAEVVTPAQLQERARWGPRS